MKIILTVAIVLAAWFLAPKAGAEGERALSIMAVMHKQYTVSKAPFVRIKRELESESPDWEKVREATGDFAKLAAALGKNEPRKGDMEAWKERVALHFADAKAMDDAAEARDKPAIQAAHKRLSASCKTCHDAHRVRNID